MGFCVLRVRSCKWVFIAGRDSLLRSSYRTIVGVVSVVR